MRDDTECKLTYPPSSPFYLLSGLTFWERHEAETAANPPTSEGACILIALKWTVKEPSWYLGVFVKRNDLKKETWWTGFIKQSVKRNELKKLSYGNWSIMPLQHINGQWWGTVCWRVIQPLLPPPSMCLLCEDMFTTIEYSYRENPFIKWNSYWCSYYHCFCIFSSPLYSLFLFPFGPKPRVCINLIPFPLLVMYCEDTYSDVKGAG